MTTTELHLPSRCLVDTNILLRISQSRAKYPKHHRAVERLALSGSRLYMAYQNVAEFWNVSTRPLELNGRGFSPIEIRGQLAILEFQFELTTEDRDTYTRWLQLIVDFNVLVRDIPAILTSNVKGFARFPQIQILDPEQMA